MKSKEKVNKPSEILNQNEIEKMLTAIKSGDISDYTEESIERKVKIYDFRRPDKFTKTQIMSIQMIHETFARLVAVNLSKKLKTLVGVHVASIDQLTWGEFVRCVPSTTFNASIRFDALNGRAMIEIDPALGLTMVSCLKKGYIPNLTKKPGITSVENIIMEAEFKQIIEQLRKAWSKIYDIKPYIDSIGNNPFQMQIVPPNECVVLITFEFKVGEIESMMNLCLPYITIEPLLFCLTPDYFMSHSRNQTSKKEQPAFPVEARIEIEGGNISYNKILKLKKGSKLPLQMTEINNMTAHLIFGNKLIVSSNITNNDNTIQFDVPEQIANNDNYNNSKKLLRKLRKNAFRSIRRRLMEYLKYFLRRQFLLR
jgi:flagellar motor switch protein FliM